jgi:hypothetical protein
MSIPFVASTKLMGKTPSGPLAGEEFFHRVPDVRKESLKVVMILTFDHHKRTNFSMSSTIHDSRGCLTAAPQPSGYNKHQNTCKTWKELLQNLAELAKGTILMGKPQRLETEPQYGVVGGHRNTEASRLPTHISSNCTRYRYETTHRVIQQTLDISPTSQFASETTEPTSMDSKYLQGVETQANSPPLSPTSSENYASTSPFGDENPRSKLLGGIPDPPFCMDYLPAKSWVVQNEARIGYVIPEKCVALNHRSRIASPNTVKVSKPKGLARIRQKSPPAINTMLAKCSVR